MDYNTLISSMNDSMKNGEIPSELSGETKPIDNLYSVLNQSLTKGEIPDESTSEAINNGADPKALAWAKSQLGKKEYENYCQLFARTAAGQESQGPSAIAAWNNQKNKGLPGIVGAQPGNLVYFQGGQYGHAGVYSGNNKFISATPWGVEENDINDWQKKTGQQLLGNLPQ